MGNEQCSNFNLRLLHCRPGFSSKLQDRKDWSTAEDDQNGIVLLDWIRMICHQKDGSKQGTQEVVNLEQTLHLCAQGDMSVTNYLRSFKSIVEAIEAAGGIPGLESAACRVVPSKINLDHDTAQPEKQ